MKIPIEASAQKTVSIVRRRNTHDASGNPDDGDTSIATDVTCDIQPNAGDIAELVSGVDPRSTHTMYPESRITATLKQLDIVIHGSNEYELLFVHDYTGAHQELDLRQIAGDR